MSRLLFTVTDTFVIRGRGLVLFPGIAPTENERFRLGDPLQLKRPDGSIIQAEIAGFEYPTPNPRREIAIMLKGINKDDVPVGTEVWSIP